MRAGSDLLSALRTIRLGRFEGTAYRAIGYRYATTALSAVGSLRYGGRYNVAGAFEALYLSMSPVTALLETKAMVETDGRLVGMRSAPRILLSIDCTLTNVLDLTDSSTLEILHTTTQALLAPWLPFVETSKFAPTQLLGSAAYSNGRISALLAPSARLPTESNLIVFSDRLKPGESIEVFDDTNRIHERFEGA